MSEIKKTTRGVSADAAERLRRREKSKAGKKTVGEKIKIAAPSRAKKTHRTLGEYGSKLAARANEGLSKLLDQKSEAEQRRLARYLVSDKCLVFTGSDLDDNTRINRLEIFSKCENKFLREAAAKEKLSLLAKIAKRTNNLKPKGGETGNKIKQAARNRGGAKGVGRVTEEGLEGFGRKARRVYNEIVEFATKVGGKAARRIRP